MAMANRLAGCDDTPPDSQVYLDGEGRRVFVGIDVDVSELLLARSLGVDGVIAHHPIGSRARLGLPAVIERHEGQMRTAGIPEALAHEMMLVRQRPVAHALHTSNYDRVVDAARQLEMPMMNIHLAADIIGRQFFIDFVNRGRRQGDTRRQLDRGASHHPGDGGLPGQAGIVAGKPGKPGWTLGGADGGRNERWRARVSHVL